MSRFSKTRGLFLEVPRNLEPWSIDDDETRAGTSLSKLPGHTSESTFVPSGFSVQQLRLHGDCSMKSGLEPGNLLSRGRYLTASPPRPMLKIRMFNLSLLKTGNNRMVTLCRNLQFFSAFAISNSLSSVLHNLAIIQHTLDRPLFSVNG
ncbi:hypothetical protein AVEN_145775-1 [Araneus ventricosus]|uniref:Uncharacterized protein n=1 Tax=Araneus ventricosus TaxID=182803 RepID=A0A4Y2T2K1_ARAVE|nr:hypothetical protein AVEN_145775-1 [Araneus ventricosus]